MAARTHTKTLIYSALLIAVCFAADASNTRPEFQKDSIWSTRRFTNDDLPCLPTQQSRTFTLHNRATQDNAYMMMAASYLAYSFWPGKRQRILSAWGFSDFEIFDDAQSSTNGYWAEHTDFLLIAFRGTQEPGDILTDISVTLEPFLSVEKNSLLVHRGFKTGANAVWRHVQTAALRAQQKGKPLILAGHSLGGAVALLSAILLEKSNLKVHTVWTFGAPKVGNNSFFNYAKNNLAERWQRINQDSDPIPALPFTANDEISLQKWADKLGGVLPVLRTFAENSKYDNAPVVSDRSSNDFASTTISQRGIKEIARGFLKHLPRAYVCDLSKNKLQL